VTDRLTDRQTDAIYNSQYNGFTSLHAFSELDDEDLDELHNEEHDASLIMHCLQCIIITNNALQESLDDEDLDELHVDKSEDRAKLLTAAQLLHDYENEGSNLLSPIHVLTGLGVYQLR